LNSRPAIALNVVPRALIAGAVKVSTSPPQTLPAAALVTSPLYDANQ
jgi:hypothetical protein